MVTDVNPLQPLKAELPIEVTELGIVTEVKELLLYAKYAGMCSTLSPITIVEIGQSVNGWLEEVKLLQLIALKFKVVKLVQPLKVELLIDVILLPILRVVKEVLSYTKYAGIVCTLSPIVIVEIGQLPNGWYDELKSPQFTALKFKVVKPLQPEKAELAIEVTELGMVTDVKLLQPLKAEFSILVTELGMVTEVKPLQL